MLLLYFLAGGLLIGRLIGGRMSRLNEIHFHWAGLAIAGLLFQLALFTAPIASRIGDFGPPLYVVSTGLVLVSLLRNVRLPGLVLVALGACLNLVEILFNGGYMPSSPAAWAGLTGVAAVPTADYTNSALSGPGTLLPFLGDVFYLPRQIPLANVFSIGDVLIGIGAAWLLIRAMRGLRSPALPDPTNRRETSAGLTPVNR